MDISAITRCGGYISSFPDRILDAKEYVVIRIINLCFPPLVTPNHLTYARLILGAAIAAILAHESAFPATGEAAADRIIIPLFTLAILTDLFDGPLARSRRIATRSGAALDPIADKALILPLIFYFLWGYDRILVICIIAGEIFSQAGRFYGMSLGHDMRANRLGKWKMTAQTAGIYLLLLRHTASGDHVLWLAFGLGFGSLWIQAHRIFPRVFHL